MRFSLPPIKCWWLLPASDYCRALFRCLNCAQRFDYLALSSSRKLGGAAEHLIGGSEKRICRLSFEFRVRMLLKGAVIRFCNVEQKKRDLYSSWVGC